MLIILTPVTLSGLPVLEDSCHSYRGVSNTRVSFEMAPVEASRSYLYRNKARIFKGSFQRLQESWPLVWLFCSVTGLEEIRWPDVIE